METIEDEGDLEKAGVAWGETGGHWGEAWGRSKGPRSRAGVAKRG